MFYYYVLCFSPVTPYYIILSSFVKWLCVVMCRDVSGGRVVSVKKAFSFYYIMTLGQCQVFFGKNAREMSD